MDKKTKLLDTNLKIWILLIVGVALGLHALFEPSKKKSVAPAIAPAPVASAPAPVAPEPAPVVAKVKAKQYIIPKGTPGGFWMSEIDEINDAYREGNDIEALRLMRKGLRRGSLILFPQTTATFVDETDGYVQLQPKVASLPFWFNKSQVRAKK